MDEQTRANELKSLVKHPGWKHVDSFILSSQTMRFNEICSKEINTENILKAVGSIEAYRRLLGWVESVTQQQDSGV